VAAPRRRGPPHRPRRAAGPPAAPRAPLRHPPTPDQHPPRSRRRPRRAREPRSARGRPRRPVRAPRPVLPRNSRATARRRDRVPRPRRGRVRRPARVPASRTPAHGRAPGSRAPDRRRLGTTRARVAIPRVRAIGPPRAIEPLPVTVRPPVRVPRRVRSLRFPERERVRARPGPRTGRAEADVPRLPACAGPAPRVPGTTRSRPRRAWGSPVARRARTPRAQVATVPALATTVRRAPVVAIACPVPAAPAGCHAPTRR